MGYFVVALLYTGCIPFCCLADYVFIRRGHRSWYGRLDIRWASATFLISNATFWFRGNSLLEACFLSTLAMASFAFSGISQSFEQWVVRHCIWHAVGGAIAVYGATRRPPEETKIYSSGHLPRLLW